MSDFDELDDMTGSMKDWVNKSKGLGLTRITPATDKKVKTFEQKVKVSADPTNPIVAQIIELLNDKVYDKAREIADSTDAESFLNTFINNYIAYGGQEEGKWLFVRQINKGARGKTASVKVELSYDADGDLNVVDVPKSMIYAVDGRKWRGKIDNLLPQPIESGGDTNFKTAVEDGGGTQTPEDKAPPMPPPTDDDPLIALIGGKTVEALNLLGIRDNVKIADLDMKTFKIVKGKEGPVKLIGNNGDEMEIERIFTGSNFGPIGESGSYIPYTSQNMGGILYRHFSGGLQDLNKKDNREITVEQLRIIRTHMDALSRVFGFDDPTQLEAFFAAWLMKDSTCRLTGIPGTGKTTVINSAASLLANSYGFNVGKRYLPQNSIDSVGQTHKYMVLPSGQSYNVNYSDKNSQSAYRAWEQWRFTEWEQLPATGLSGAYLYDFRFLQETSDSGYAKIPMKIEHFAELLLATPIRNKSGVNTDEIKATPIKFADLQKLFGVKGLPNSITNNSGNALYLKSSLYNDSGANEGYALREFLLEHFYDNRLQDKENGFGIIIDEMLQETGIAKIDYDKRAEEILYGIEIRQITDKQIVGGEEKEVASYQFDPTPRPIVTQPIKFFNEANRSGSGVEDAILGLIAEQTVEYRGQTFKSPSFVAWMDTNPHQKGNDLAFVDRIDMELYFGTLTLGGLFNTLGERYGGANSKGSRPEFQLLQRMLVNKGTSRYLKPMRFHELSNVWGTIIDLPMNASGSSDDEEGALLDISMIATLFTQRYMVKEKQDDIYGMPHVFKDDKDIYASPLVDISTTTNAQYEAQHPTWIEPFGSGKGGTPFQAPVLITRMLGFRFTNSLVKMTRALAFLRGKDHVTRQEVIDALPYCVGHRLGPAREGEDPKGRDIGIVRDAMRVSNEQDFIREIILNGYVLRNTKGGMGEPAGKQSLFDIWDSFLKNCFTHMDSTDAFWKYEKGVVLDIKHKVRTNKGTGITPVHWAIATMVVDNERKRDEYKSRYSSYLERISRPASLKGTRETDIEVQKAQLLANTSAAQYIKVRGDIAGDPFLFSDDRAKLLSLVDSKIDAMCGKTLKATLHPNSANFMAISPTKGTEYQMGSTSYSSFDESISGPNATSFKWRCYGDAMGAWGTMVTNGSNLTAKIAKLGATTQFLDVGGAEYESNQTLSVNTQFIIPIKEEAVENTKFTNRMENLFETFGQYTTNGVQIGEIKTGINGILEKYSNLSEYATQAEFMLNEWLSNNAKNQNKVNATMEMGFNACFRLNHIDVGVDESMKIKMDDGRETIINGEDDLRLWLSLRVIQGNNKTAGKEAMVSLFIGITSACMRPTQNTAGTIITDADGNPTSWEVLPFSEDGTYNPTNYSGTEAQTKKSMYQDIGNITIKDYKQYIIKGLRAIGNETV